MTPIETLSDREVEVLTFTANGATRREIAKLLSLSGETVKDYLDRACKKLRAVNKTHAVALAVHLGIITPFGKKPPQRTTH